MTIITETLEKLKRKIEALFEQQDASIGAAEKYLTEAVNGTICELLGAYYEACNQVIYAGKRERKKEGLSLVRHGDRRRVETVFGGVEFRRDYYRKTDGSYCYPADEIAGISSYMRMSDESAAKLVRAAVRMPYAKANEYAMGGRFTAQTVMNKVRLACPDQEAELEQKRRVSCLHIDADEDHVNLHQGGNTIVPLSSVYEGIRHTGKRGSCVGIRHYSGYGMKTDEMWESVLEEIEKRYDLEGTHIYLHGDGAAWIRTGLEWLPGSRFVLDRYHYNKALKRAVSGLKGSVRGQYVAALRRALEAGNVEDYDKVCSRLCEEVPARSQKSADSLAYLRNNIDGISIYSTDPEASNGGCTEPHVSTVYSARLSSRPAGWSPETLSVMSRLLTGCSFSMTRTQKGHSPSAPVTSMTSRARVAVHAALGAPDPARIGSLPALDDHSSQLVMTLRSIANLC